MFERTYFLYGGTNLVCEMNSSGSLTAVNDFGADGVWARHTQVTDWFYTFDPQGCLSQKIGRDGSVLCSSIYDAQGHEATTDTQPDPFSGYGGQFGYYADWETSTTGGGSCLYLLGHRFYDPDAGRFLTRDPMGYAGGINLYAYTGNNPVNRADPSGFNPIAANNGGSSGGDPCCTDPFSNSGWGTGLGTTIGGGLGAIAGGLLGSAFGPVGTIIGSGIGGAVGGAFGGYAGSEIGDLLNGDAWNGADADTPEGYRRAKCDTDWMNKRGNDGAVQGGVLGGLGGVIYGGGVVFVPLFS